MNPLPPTTIANFEPVLLSGNRVSLVPLAAEHLDGLISAVRDGELWNLWYTSAPEPENVAAEIARRLTMQESGSMIPFTVLDAAGSIVGMTTYMNIDHANQRVEIGSTWYAKSAQRTGLNTEAKLLLLTHAFETLNCIAVEFRTHIMNQRSRRAIERLGAKLDGILRNHSYARNGTLRDTVVYSIIASEWPSVKAHLAGLMAKQR
jgi:RimJ/RimL family protein N-acetyltransferase